MTNLTTNEIDVLNGIAYHEMSPANGGKPLELGDTGCWCWVDTFSKILTPQQVKGVLASLIKKDLVRVSPYDRRDTIVDFTRVGFEVWQRNDDNRSE